MAQRIPAPCGTAETACPSATPQSLSPPLPESVPLQRWPAPPPNAATTTVAAHRPLLRPHPLFAVRLTHLEGRQVVAGGQGAYLYVRLRIGGRQHTTPFATICGNVAGNTTGGVDPSGELGGIHGAGGEDTGTALLRAGQPTCFPADGSPSRTFCSAAPAPVWPLHDAGVLFYWDGRSAMPDVEFTVCARAAAAVDGQRQTLLARAAVLAELLEDSDDDDDAASSVSSRSCSHSSDDTTTCSSTSSYGRGEGGGGVRGGAGVTSRRPRPLREAEEAAWPAPKPRRRRKGERGESEAAQGTRQTKSQRRGYAPAGEGQTASAARYRRHRERASEDAGEDPVAAQPVLPSPTDRVVGYARVRLDATMLDRTSKLLVRPPKGGRSTTMSAVGRSSAEGPGGGLQRHVAASPSVQGTSAPLPQRASLATAITTAAAAAAAEAPVYTTVQLGTRDAGDAALLRLFGTLGSLRFALSAVPLATVQRDTHAGPAAATAGDDEGADAAAAMVVRRAAGGQTTVEAYIQHQEEQLRATLDRLTAHGALHRELRDLFSTAEPQRDGYDGGDAEDQNGLPAYVSAPPPPPSRPRSLTTHVPPSALPAVAVAPSRGCALVQATFHPLDPILDLHDVRSYLAARREAQLGAAVHQLEVLRQVRQLDPGSRAAWWTAKQRWMVRRARESGAGAAGQAMSAPLHPSPSSPSAPPQGVSPRTRRRQQAQRRRRSSSTSGGTAASPAEEDDDASGDAPFVSVDALLAQRGGTLHRLLWSGHTAVTLLVRTSSPATASPAVAADRESGAVAVWREWPTTVFACSLRGVDPAQAVLWRLQQRRKRAFADALDQWVAAAASAPACDPSKGERDAAATMAAQGEARGGTRDVAGDFSASFLSAPTHATASAATDSDASAGGDDPGSSGGDRDPSSQCGGSAGREALASGVDTRDAPDPLAQTARAALPAATAHSKAAEVQVKEAETPHRPRSGSRLGAASATAPNREEPQLPQAPADANGFMWDRLCLHFSEEDILSLHVTVRVSLAPLPPLSTVLLPDAPATAASFALSATPSASRTFSPAGERDGAAAAAAAGSGGDGGSNGTSAVVMRSTTAGDSTPFKCAAPLAPASLAAANAAATAVLPSPSSSVPPQERYTGYPAEDLCVCALPAASVVRQLTSYVHRQQQQQRRCNSLSSSSTSLLRESADDGAEEGERLVPLFMPCYRVVPSATASSAAAATAGTGVVGGRAALCGWLRVVLHLSPTFSLTRLRALQAQRDAQPPLLSIPSAPHASSLPPLPFFPLSAAGAHAAAPSAELACVDRPSPLPTGPPPAPDSQAGVRHADSSGVPGTAVADDGETPAPMPAAFVAAIPTASPSRCNAAAVEKYGGEAVAVRGYAHGGGPGGAAGAGPAAAATAPHHPAVASMEWAACAAAASTASAAAAAAAAAAAPPPPWLSAPSLGDGGHGAAPNIPSAEGNGGEREDVLGSLPTAPTGGLVLRVDQAVAAGAAETGGGRQGSAALVEGHHYYAVVSFPASSDVRGAAAAAVQRALPSVLLFQAPSAPAVQEDAAAENQGKEKGWSAPQRHHVHDADSPQRRTTATPAAAAVVTAQWLDATYVLEACGPYAGLPLRVDVVEVTFTTPAAGRASAASSPTVGVTQAQQSAAETAPRLIGSVVFHYSTLPLVGHHRFPVLPPLPSASTPLSTLPRSGDPHAVSHSAHSSSGRTGASQAGTALRRGADMTVTLSWSISPELQQRCLLARLRRLHREDLVAYAVTEEGVRWVWDGVPRCAAVLSSVTPHPTDESAVAPGWAGAEGVKEARDEGWDLGGGSITMPGSPAGDAATAPSGAAPARSLSVRQEGPSSRSQRTQKGLALVGDTSPLGTAAAATASHPPPPLRSLPSEREMTEEQYGVRNAAVHYQRDGRPSPAEPDAAVKPFTQQRDVRAAWPSPLPPPPPPLFPHSTYPTFPHGRQDVDTMMQPPAMRPLSGRRHPPRPGEQRLSTPRYHHPHHSVRGHRRRGDDGLDVDAPLRLCVTVLSLQNLRLPFTTTPTTTTATAATGVLPSTVPAGASLIPYVVVRYGSESKNNLSLTLPAVCISAVSAAGGGGCGGGSATLVSFTAEFDVGVPVLCDSLIAVEVRDVCSRRLFGVAHLPLPCPSTGDRCSREDGEGRGGGAGGGALGETVTHVVPVYRPVQLQEMDTDCGGASGGAEAVLASLPPFAPSSPVAHALLDVVAPVVGQATVLTTFTARPRLTRRLAQQPVFMHLTVLGARGLTYQPLYADDGLGGRGGPHARGGGVGAAPDAYVVVTVRRCDYALGSHDGSDGCSGCSSDSSIISGDEDEDRRQQQHPTLRRDGVWSSRDYRSRTIPRRRDPLWYLDLPPQLCCSPADVYTFTVYHADDDGFDCCIGACCVSAGALLRRRQGRETETGGDQSYGFASAPQSLQLPLRPRSGEDRGGDAAADVGRPGTRDDTCGSVLLEWSFLSSSTVTVNDDDAACSEAAYAALPKDQAPVYNSSRGGSQLAHRTHAALTRSPSLFSPAAAAVVVEVQLVAATALALDATAASQLRAHCMRASCAPPVVLAALSLAHEGEGGEGIVLRDRSRCNGAWGAFSAGHQRGVGASLSAFYRVVVGTLRLDSGVVHQQVGRGARGIADILSDEEGGYTRPYASCAYISSTATNAVGPVSMDADFPSSVVLTLSLRSPPPPLRVQLWLRHAPRTPASHYTTAARSAASPPYTAEDVQLLTQSDVFLGEAAIHLAALTPCASPLQEARALTSLLRPRRDPRCRTADLTRANAVPTGLGTVTLSAAVYALGVYEARQRHQARQCGWQAQLTVAVQEATEFEGSGAFAVEVCCTGSGAVRRTRVVADRNPRFHETFAFVLDAPRETVEVRLLEWPSSPECVTMSAAPCVTAATTFHVELGDTGASLQEGGAQAGAAPTVHTAWLTLRPVVDAFAASQAAEGIYVSRAGVAPKLLVRWRARVSPAVAAAAMNTAGFESDTWGQRGGKDGGEDVQDVGGAASPGARDDLFPLHPTGSTERSSPPDDGYAGAFASRPSPSAPQMERLQLVPRSSPELGPPFPLRPPPPNAGLPASPPSQQHPIQEGEPVILNVLWLTGELVAFLGTGSSTARDVLDFCAARSRRLEGQSNQPLRNREVDAVGLCVRPLTGSGAEAEAAAVHPSAAQGLPLDVPLLHLVRNGDYVQVTQRLLEDPSAPAKLSCTPSGKGQACPDVRDDGGVEAEEEARGSALSAAGRSRETQQHRSCALPHTSPAPQARQDAHSSTAVVIAGLHDAARRHLSRAWATAVHQRCPLWWLTDRATLLHVNTAVVQRMKQRAKRSLEHGGGSSENVREKEDSVGDAHDDSEDEQPAASLHSQRRSVPHPSLFALRLTFLYSSVADADVLRVVQWLQAHRAVLTGFCRPVIAAVPHSFHVAERLFCVVRESRAGDLGWQAAQIAHRSRTPPTTAVEAVEMHVQGSASALYVLLCFLRRTPAAQQGAPLLPLVLCPAPAVTSNAASRADERKPTVSRQPARSTGLLPPPSAPPPAPLLPLLAVEEVVGYVPALRRGLFQLACSAWEARQVWATMAERPATGQRDRRPTDTEARASPALFYHFADPRMSAGNWAEKRDGEPGVVVMDLREERE